VPYQVQVVKFTCEIVRKKKKEKREREREREREKRRNCFFLLALNLEI